MSLENIQLPSVVLRNLFKNHLVDLKSNEPNKAIAKSVPFSFLGNNKSAVAILTSDSQHLHLADEDLGFLTGMINACNLTLADVAVINLFHSPDLDNESLEEHLHPDKIILFGLDHSSIDLPFHIPHFQVQRYNEKRYLISPSLNELQKSKELKGKLWIALQQLFDLKK